MLTKFGRPAKANVMGERSICHQDKNVIFHHIWDTWVSDDSRNRLEICDGKAFCFEGDEEPLKSADELTSTSSCII